MQDKDKNTPSRTNFPIFQQSISEEEKKLGKYEREEDIPTLAQVLEYSVTPGTMIGQLDFPDKDIIFTDSKLSPVKSLKVRIRSTESIDMAILHKLHSHTRTET